MCIENKYVTGECHAKLTLSQQNEMITWSLLLFCLHHFVPNVDQSKRISLPLYKSISGKESNTHQYVAIFKYAHEHIPCVVSDYATILCPKCICVYILFVLLWFIVLFMFMLVVFMFSVIVSILFYLFYFVYFLMLFIYMLFYVYFMLFKFYFILF